MYCRNKHRDAAVPGIAEGGDRGVDGTYFNRNVLVAQNIIKCM